MRLFEEIDGKSIILVEKLKKISSELLSSEINLDLLLTTLQSVLGVSLSKDAIKSLQQNQLDDIASLRRVGRIKHIEGIDYKKIIQSGYYFISC